MSLIPEDRPGLSGAKMSLTRLCPLTTACATLSLSAADLRRVSPTAWAYLGDAVYELYVRSWYLMPPKRSQTYHQLVVAQVRAESQARHLQCLEPHLTDAELEIVKRGRNATVGRPKRLEPEIYQQATSLETLVGYLYITNPQRLTELFSYLELDP